VPVPQPTFFHFNATNSEALNAVTASTSAIVASRRGNCLCRRGSKWKEGQLSGLFPDCSQFRRTSSPHAAAVSNGPTTGLSPDEWTFQPKRFRKKGAKMKIIGCHLHARRARLAICLYLLLLLLFCSLPRRDVSRLLSFLRQLLLLRVFPGW